MNMISAIIAIFSSYFLKILLLVTDPLKILYCNWEVWTCVYLLFYIHFLGFSLLELKSVSFTTQKLFKKQPEIILIRKPYNLMYVCFIFWNNKQTDYFLTSCINSWLLTLLCNFVVTWRKCVCVCVSNVRTIKTIGQFSLCRQSSHFKQIFIDIHTACKVFYLNQALFSLDLYPC